jgi:small subunit ribosomal protein S8
MLAKIKNASMARKESLVVPFSKNDFEVAKILVASGFLKDAQKRVFGRKQMIEIKLVTKTDGQQGISDFKIVSKPSRHLYYGYRDIRTVRQNFGIAVVSTPRGIMTGASARKAKVGGEYLFEVW